MTQFLPPNLLALFAPRDPLPYKPPVDKLVHEKKSQPYSGLSAFVTSFEVCRVLTVLSCAYVLTLTPVEEVIILLLYIVSRAMRQPHSFVPTTVDTAV